MATVLLVRHGRSTANTSGVLAGHTPGVNLDEVGQSQADRLAERLVGLDLVAAFSSPLDRCIQTAQRALVGRDLTLQTDDRVAECKYGDWTGKELKELINRDTEAVGEAQADAAVALPGPII